MWNSINKLIDPSFKSIYGGSRKNLKIKRGKKRPNNKKRKFREDKKLNFKDKRNVFRKRKRDREERNKEKKYFDFKGKKKFFKKKHTKSSGFTNKVAS